MLSMRIPASSRWFWGVIFGVGLVWAYEPSLRQFVHRWSTDQRYSHGSLVPLFALFLLWLRRKQLVTAEIRPSVTGIVWIAAALALRWAGVFTYYQWYDHISILVCLAGVVVLLAGSRALRWAAPSIAFLFFMIPLPYRFEIALSGPLQHIATVSSTYMLQTFGFPAIDEGNIITISDHQLGVAEACSGLSMMILFFALSTAIVLMVKRPTVDKLILLASSIPIALIANVARITLTGTVGELVSSKAAHVVFHDAAGWVMTPLALAMFGVELYLLSRLFREEPSPTTTARAMVRNDLDNRKSNNKRAQALFVA
jgi:exosortase